VAYGILAISNGIKSKGKNISAELIKESWREPSGL
jgi:hypothetical protein